ncbi:hypothetical protein BLX87_09360 [Bacillus sp. VT-16-64]|nr:hypothetical protein BLX87_09360 [Bacillus sp. VT-16-64]
MLVEPIGHLGAVSPTWTFWVDTSQLPRVPGAGAGQSRDGTLWWDWHVADNGSRKFTAQQWGRTRLVTVIDDKIAAPK